VMCKGKSLCSFVLVMNLRVAVVCSTTPNTPYEAKGTVIRVVKPWLSEKQVRMYRQGVTLLAGSLCCLSFVNAGLFSRTAPGMHLTRSFRQFTECTL
jgi:hypothetical protein